MAKTLSVCLLAFLALLIVHTNACINAPLVCNLPEVDYASDDLVPVCFVFSGTHKVIFYTNVDEFTLLEASGCREPGHQVS